MKLVILALILVLPAFSQGFLSRGQVILEAFGGFNFGPNRSGLTPTIPPSAGVGVTVGAWKHIALDGAYSWNKVGGVGGVSSSLQTFSAGAKVFTPTSGRIVPFAGLDLGDAHAAVKLGKLSVNGDRFLIAPMAGAVIQIAPHFAIVPQYRLLKPWGATVYNQALVGLATTW